MVYGDVLHLNIGNPCHSKTMEFCMDIFLYFGAEELPYYSETRDFNTDL